MSKKPQIKQNPKAKIQIVDQQTQPFLRTLQKRVRNINKKLTQIAQIAKKEDLKPEQIQKVNRKAQYLEQKNKLEQTASYYRQTLIENAQYYRNLQLKQLDNVATSIAVFNTGRFKDHQKLQEFHSFFFGSSNLNITLNDRIQEVSTKLRAVLTDQKLKKALTTFVAENGTRMVEDDAEQAVNEEQVNLVAALVSQPVKKEEPIVAKKVEEHKTQVKPVVVEQTKVQPVAQEVPVSAKTQQSKPVQEKKEGAQQDRRPRGENRTRNNNRNRDGNRQYRDRNNNQHNPTGQRKYKPKYEAKGQNQRQAQDRQSSSDEQFEEPEVRNFRRDQISKLENEGFTVIGKPKPKAKTGQKEWHEHTHGRKQHHHHDQNV